MGAAPFGGHSSKSSLSSFSVSFGPETTLFSAREEIDLLILLHRHLEGPPATWSLKGHLMGYDSLV